MADYLDSVTGIYPTVDDAQKVAQTLIDRGFSKDQVQIAIGRTEHIEQDEDDKASLKNVVVDGAIGTAIGAGVGALGQIAIVAANVSLFVASPLVAPLFMVGWGAAIGGFIGAGKGISNQDRRYSELLANAVEKGHAVLVANATTEEEVETARAIVGESMQQYA
ncbi:hypothetical protein LG198_04310 [Methylobacillus arboreus]|uniref:hypothetical protein n=1 Tax=Methylobacillus arboreus TaxID=755170 RepID=UPI001E4F8963|nr:hypothetical protein [Methylobacillus arboreus]MCB5189950.1 hypothetical protein [Methylobacillus arboreus]